MHANVIDTLHFANGLKATGFAADQAEGLAQALNDQLAPQMITPTILRDELRPIGEHLGRLDAHVVRLDAHMVRLDEKIDALGTRLDEKIDSVESKLTTKIDAAESRLDARVKAVEFKLLVLSGTIALGFTALFALGIYQAPSHGGQKSAQTTQTTIAPQNTSATAQAAAPQMLGELAR